METTIKQRLTEYLAHKKIGQTKFELLAGLSRGYINKLNNDMQLSSLRNILRIATDLNREWLETGEGEMLTSDTTTLKKSSVPMIPEASFRFAAGQTHLVNEKESINRYWYLPDCADCEAVVPIVGDSMSPTLPSGSYAALRRFEVAGNNPNTIPFGQMFGIVVEDEHSTDWHGYIKVLHRHKDPEMASRYWIAHSFNPDYDDFDIPLSQVRSLWIVKQHVVTDIAY